MLYFMEKYIIYIQESFRYTFGQPLDGSVNITLQIRGARKPYRLETLKIMKQVQYPPNTRSTNTSILF